MDKNIPMLDEKIIKNYCKESDIGYILEVDIEYPKNLHDLHGNLPFLPERMKINKCNKLVCNLYDKKLCCPHNRVATQLQKKDSRTFPGLFKENHSFFKDNFKG